MKKLPLLLLFVSLSFFAYSQPLVSSEVVSATALDEANAKVQSFIDEGKLSGISTMVIQNGEVISQEFFGYANKEEKHLVNHNTIFRIFSMTKPVTTVALMTLYDEGAFELDDPVSKYIPEFQNVRVFNPDPDQPIVPQQHEFTIRELLTHTSGITYGWDPESPIDSLYRVKNIGNWQLNTLEEEINELVTVPLKYQPGTRWEYGLGIDVAGYLVERLSGQSLDVFMKERIFDPLNMQQTGFHVLTDDRTRFSALYEYNKSGNLQQVENPMADVFLSPRTFFSGGGGLVSTLDDYANFALMLRNGGELNGVRVLESSTADLIMSNQLPAGVKFAETDTYGLGGSFDPRSDTYGWAGAASTKFWYNKSKDLIVIFYTQLMPSDFKFADAYYNIINGAEAH